MYIRERKILIRLLRQIQALQKLVERNEFDLSPAAPCFMRGLRAFADSSLFASKRDENVTLGGYARIRAARIHDHLHKMIDLRSARLFDRHRNGDAFICKRLRSFVFRMDVFQKGLEHRSVRMDIGAEDLEILRFTPDAVILFILTKINVHGSAYLLYDVHGRARVFLALMYIHRLFDRKLFASAVKSDLSAFLKHLSIQALAIKKTKLQSRHFVSLASLAKKIDVILHGVSDHKLILSFKKSADLLIKMRKRRCLFEFFFRISKQDLGIFGTSCKSELGFGIDHKIIAFQFIEAFIRDHVSKGTDASLSAVCAFNIKKYVSQKSLLSENTFFSSVFSVQKENQHGKLHVGPSKKIVRSVKYFTRILRICQ